MHSTDFLRLSCLAVTLVAGLKAQDAAAAKPASPFAIHHKSKTHIDVQHKGRPVLRLMIANDTSTKQRAHATYKVFAHVMDLTDPEGKRRLTKGAGHKFTHHRGIFVGWSKAKIDGIGKVDTWHMKGNRQCFAKILSQKTGKDQAELTVAIDWKTDDGKVLLREARTFIVHQPEANGGVEIDVASKITAVAGNTVLRGDPEHAGVQFRAHEAVVKNKSAKYRFKPGMKPGNKGNKDMPWAAMTFQANDRQYHVLHMSHPSLPKGNIYSAYRDYGRFGAYFQKSIPKGESATFRVRFYVAPGGFPKEDVEAKLNARFMNFARSVK